MGSGSQFQLFNMLGPAGMVRYADCDPCEDMNVWHITSGSSACVVLTKDTVAAAAFRTVGKNNSNKTMHYDRAEKINAKMQIQVQCLRGAKSIYKWHDKRWQLCWGSGDHAWLVDDAI
jgi:hypothetical protein